MISTQSSAASSEGGQRRSPQILGQMSYGEEKKVALEDMTTVRLLHTKDLRVMPILAIDFSMGNLTFDNNTFMHSENP